MQCFQTATVIFILLGEYKTQIILLCQLRLSKHSSYPDSLFLPVMKFTQNGRYFHTNILSHGQLIILTSVGDAKEL